MSEQSLENQNPTRHIIKWLPLTQDEQAIIDNIAYVNWQASQFNHSDIKEDGSRRAPLSLSIINTDALQKIT